MTKLSRYEKKKYERLDTRSRHLVREMLKLDIVNPVMVLEEARRLNKRYVPLSLLCSLLIQESGGGKNIFGSDPVKPPQIRTRNYARPVRVTRARYAIYKALRRRGYGMQGVGPLQLTWYEFQDAADKLGGCWHARMNIRYGAQKVQGLIAQYGSEQGIRKYNGSGPAAVRYSAQVRARAAEIHRKLG